MAPEFNTEPTRWLLLIHRLPAKPAYLRVRIGRKLQSLGAVAIKNAVYALPNSSAATGAFRDLLSEITRGGGEGFLCEANLIDGLTDIAVRGLFDAVRDADYEALARDGRHLLDRKQISRAEVEKLRRRHEEIVRADYFGAHGRQTADDVLSELERRMTRHADVRRIAGAPRFSPADLKNRVWVTRRHIHVDRIASAWLIRRFIDPAAVFKFVDAKKYKPRRDHLRFDMADAEFTHEGKDCTFETLLRYANLRADPALCAIGEIIHDLDVEDRKFGRLEAAGVGALVAGICASAASDEDRLTLGSVSFDQLYAHFGRT
ncbi:MAG: chromate resistance protein ChrB domain-containing protein [Rhodospirillaceae bacterium]